MWRSYSVRILLLAGLLLPVVIQAALALTGVLLDGVGLNLQVLLWSVAAVLGLCMGWLCARWSLAWRESIPWPVTQFALLWPALLPWLLMLAAWVISMAVTGNDFTRSSWAELVFLPYLGLAFLSAFSGQKWWLLIYPSLASVGFLIGFTWRLRSAVAMAGKRTGSMLMLGVLLTSLLSLAGWQGYQRSQETVNERGESLREEISLEDYEPHAPDNRLVRVEPAPKLRFDKVPRLDGATAAYPVYAAMAQALYTPAQAKDAVQMNRTSKAFERLIKGETDVIFTAQASPQQQAAAQAQGVKLKFTPIGREAFVFVTYRDNPLRSLTLEQVRGIYSGQITNWRQLGGKPGRIIAYQRPENSGSQTVMQAKVMQGLAMRKPLQEEVAQGMGGLIRRVATYRNGPEAIGYSFRFYASQMRKADELQLLAIDGIEPNVTNIESGRYPLTVDVYMVTREDESADVKTLRNWITSEAGRKLIRDVGYVPY